MEATIKQKVGRIALTGRKMFDIDVVINDKTLGSLSLHTFWRDMPYPMYGNKIRKLQRITNLMVENNTPLETMVLTYEYLNYFNVDIPKAVYELSQHENSKDVFNILDKFLKESEVIKA